MKELPPLSAVRRAFWRLERSIMVIEDSQALNGDDLPWSCSRKSSMNLLMATRRLVCGSGLDKFRSKWCSRAVHCCSIESFIPANISEFQHRRPIAAV